MWVFTGEGKGIEGVEEKGDGIFTRRGGGKGLVRRGEGLLGIVKRLTWI